MNLILTRNPEIENSRYALRPRPIDRTPGTPGSDKNISMRHQRGLHNQFCTIAALRTNKRSRICSQKFFWNSGAAKAAAVIVFLSDLAVPGVRSRGLDVCSSTFPCCADSTLAHEANKTMVGDMVLQVTWWQKFIFIIYSRCKWHLPSFSQKITRAIDSIAWVGLADFSKGLLP